MIDGLLIGRLAADPKAGTASKGNPYVTARVIVTTGAEDRLSVSVIAFDAATVAGLLALGKDEAVSLAGELTPKVWTGQGRPRQGIGRHESACAADPVSRAAQAAYDGG